MDIKLIKNKNLVALVICFCITIITANIDMKDFYMNYINADFYKSYELEQVLYEIATQSVYTVVGDNASEKMLDYKAEGRNMISNYTTANVFVINNDSKEVYYNNISDIDKYLKTVTKSYHNVYEINFKDKTMYLLNDNNDKVRVSTNHFGNLAQTKKEDVTTYIAIPFIINIEEMKEINHNEPLYVKYKEFIKNTDAANFFVGCKIIASTIIITYYLSMFILGLSKKDILNKILKNILLISLAFIISLLQSKIYGWSILYYFINTGLLYLIYYFGFKILEENRKNNIHPKDYAHNLIVKLTSLKMNNKKIYTIIKYVWIFIPLTIIQVIIMSTYDYNYGLFEFSVYTAPLLSIALCVISIFIIKDKVNKIETIRNGIYKIKNGNIEHKIEIKKDLLFDDIVKDINEIGETVNIAVEERLKSERMKNELITNVSHDLKTPLTAIINYISLMKKEDIQPKHINDYVQVLDKRSQRLKILIEDLFEASKIGSNNIELNLEENDINQLLTQTLVEMEDYINKSKLDFIVNTPDKEVYILADGKKTFRVFENIISNILKYSLEKTRVYIDLVERDGKVHISFKNISKYQLNFDPDEITERFTRGDLSRNTEGSGLGLAIAKGLIEAQGGELKVDIIGDLFIVNIDFNI
ncbi:MAG: HAMP domain-containing histidine kinase [Romboutsia sp.]|uniref:sensor histidine kinase n=1 Tax=Romboutsia sp. TaxID=1965302 RepID=UPI00216C1491|nr:HAMP domain-containing sensor histidine kinase [Romboutsia sp.]MCI9259745.1 HAMP domain-containing histidine kinase [Romboutsia sp.]